MITTKLYNKQIELVKRSSLEDYFINPLLESDKVFEKITDLDYSESNIADWVNTQFPTAIKSNSFGNIPENSELNLFFQKSKELKKIEFLSILLLNRLPKYSKGYYHESIYLDEYKPEKRLKFFRNYLKKETDSIPKSWDDLVSNEICNLNGFFTGYFKHPKRFYESFYNNEELEIFDEDYLFFYALKEGLKNKKIIRQTGTTILLKLTGGLVAKMVFRPSKNESIEGSFRNNIEFNGFKSISLFKLPPFEDSQSLDYLVPSGYIYKTKNMAISIEFLAAPMLLSI